ncbi:MAG: DNA-directed RNA polymerase subunit K, partial [Candidatus Njordarchaeales archaeon]
PRLTIYELARIIGARAIQIAYGAPILIPIPREAGNEPIEITIAKEELKAKVLPITIQRWLPDGRYQNIPVTWLKYDPYI